MQLLATYTYQLIGRTIRVGRMSFLLALGSGARLGVEKFLVIPILIPILGESKIGQFVWLLAWAMILGQFSGGGVSDSLLRLHAKAKDFGVWSSLVGIGTIITTLISFTIVFAVGLFFLPTDFYTCSIDKIIIVLGLGFYACSMAGRFVLSAYYRVRFQFEWMATLDIIAAIALLMAIPLSMIYGVSGLSCGYAFSAMLALIIGIIFLRKSFTQTTWNLNGLGLTVMASAPIFAMTSMLGVGFYQAGRIIIGLFKSYSDVTVFFAAESIIALSLLPLSYVAGAIYSYVSSKATIAEIDRNLIVQHIVFCLISALVILFTINIVGRYLLSFLFGSVKEQALPILNILAIGAAVKSLYLLCRGFLYKFSSHRLILFYTIGGFLTIIVLLLVLTPSYGIIGSAWAVSIANICVGILWFGTYIWLFALKRYG